MGARGPGTPPTCLGCGAGGMGAAPAPYTPLNLRGGNLRGSEQLLSVRSVGYNHALKS